MPLDIQELGSLSELIAALATLATLAYLALQIRQNTRAIRGSTLHSVTQTQQNELHWGGEIAGVFTKAIENQTALTPVEAWQMSEWLMSAMAARQNEYVQYRDGHITQEVWEASENIIRIVASFDWGRNWWVTFGNKSFSVEFVALVDELMGRDRIVNLKDVVQGLMEFD